MKKPVDILQKYWGYPSFRPVQEDIINAVLQKKDTLALLPTGGGKSICFQVPSLMMEGVCIVVSPLIALMKDQVDSLNRYGIPATYINSTLTTGEQSRRLDDERRELYDLQVDEQTPLEDERLEALCRQVVAGSREAGAEEAGHGPVVADGGPRREPVRSRGGER